MDPNALLRRIRELRRRLAGADAHNPEDVSELLTNLLDLDAWITNGGFLPYDWQPRDVRLDDEPTE